MGKKTAAERREHQRLGYKLGVAEIVAGTLNTIFRVSGFVICMYWIYRSVEAVAGQTTAADIGIRFLSDIRVSESLAWLFGGGGILFGWRQRSLRRDVIERLSPRQQELEKGIDPHRTSSKLTARGETNPEDKL